MGALQVLKEVETIWMRRKPAKTLRNVSRARLLFRRAVDDKTVPVANRTSHMLVLLHRNNAVLTRAMYLIRVPKGASDDLRDEMRERRFTYQAYLLRFVQALREYMVVAPSPLDADLPGMAEAVCQAVNAWDPDEDPDGEVEGYFDDLPDLK